MGHDRKRRTNKYKQGTRRSNRTTHIQRNPDDTNLTNSVYKTSDGSTDKVTVELKSYHSDMFNKFHTMQKEGRLCDVKLQTRTGHVMAHKLILMTTSSYFCEQLMQRTIGQKDRGIEAVDVTDIPIDDLSDIVSFIYTGKVVMSETHIGVFVKFCRSLGLTILYDILKTQETKIKKEVIPEDYQESSLVLTDTAENHGSETDLGKKNRNNVLNCVHDDLSLRNTRKNPTDPSYKESIPGASVTQGPHTNGAGSNKSNDKSDANLYTDRDTDTCDTDEDTDTCNTDEDTDSCVETDDKVCDLINHTDKNKRGSDTIDHENSFNDGVPSKKQKIQGLFCRQCGTEFSSQSEQDEHKQTCAVVRARKRCIICKITFSTAEEYNHHRENDLKCRLDRQERYKIAEKKKQERKRRYSCKVCKFRCKEWADLLDHEFKVHDLPYEKDKWTDLFCEWCDYTTISKCALQRHKSWSCSLGREYICDQCGNNFKNDLSLRRHKKRIHDAITMIPCKQCGKILKNQANLKFHMKNMHKGESVKKYMCHMCSSKYQSPNDLTFHLFRNHSQPLPEGFVVYRCPQCDYVINHKGTLEKHKLLHDERRAFTCEICYKTFKTSNQLNCHVKDMHTDKKKIPCPYEHCKYIARSNNPLKNHIENQHTKKGMKNEKCHVCSYSTFYKGNLTKHLRKVHQLEVVTKYTVNMKAKYRNLNSGDIVGPSDKVGGTENERFIPHTGRTLNENCDGVNPFPVQ